MIKFKNWLLLRFLPSWAKESVYNENKKLKEKIIEQQNEIENLKSYISGIEYAFRRTVVVKNEVNSK